MSRLTQLAKMCFLCKTWVVSYGLVFSSLSPEYEANCSIPSAFDDPTVSASYKTVWLAGSRLNAAMHENRSM